MAKRNKSNILKDVAIGSAIAAAAGYLAGVLTAPKSGKQTRKDLQQAADKGRVQAEKELKKLHTELNVVLKDAKSKSKTATKKTQEELKELMEKAGDTKEKVREIISAIHEGDAEDEELKRALKNAKIALNNLKDYLKK